MEGLKKAMYGQMAENLQSDFEEGGFEAIGQKALETSNIKPIYTLEQKDPETFHANREKLNTEAGLIIANHPGYYDTFLLLKTLKRKDVKIVVSGSNYKTYAPIVGEERLIKATDDPSEAFAFLRSIKEHVEGGGLVLIYPSGGTDRADKNNDNPEFENGFSVILRRCLKPSDMVYAFHIVSEDIREVIDEKISRMVGATSALAIDPALNINRLKDTAEMRVDEKYSTANEWLEVLAGASKDEKNAALTEHFAESFKE